MAHSNRLVMAFFMLKNLRNRLSIPGVMGRKPFSGSCSHLPYAQPKRCKLGEFHIEIGKLHHRVNVETTKHPKLNLPAKRKFQLVVPKFPTPAGSLPYAETNGLIGETFWTAPTVEYQKLYSWPKNHPHRSTQQRVTACQQPQNSTSRKWPGVI